MKIKLLTILIIGTFLLSSNVFGMKGFGVSSVYSEQEKNALRKLGIKELQDVRKTLAKEADILISKIEKMRLNIIDLENELNNLEKEESQEKNLLLTKINSLKKELQFFVFSLSDQGWKIFFIDSLLMNKGFNVPESWNDYMEYMTR